MRGISVYRIRKMKIFLDLLKTIFQNFPTEKSTRNGESGKSRNYLWEDVRNQI